MMEKVRQLRVDLDYFFRMAHQWRFGRSVDSQAVRLDVLQQEHFGITPKYVEDYVHHLQQVEDAQPEPRFPGYEVFQQ